MQFLTAITAASNDQITATGTNEILTGSAATGLLNQTVTPGITFRGTLAALDSDIITNFGSNDFIDITNLASGRATALGPGPAAGLLHIAYGNQSANLTLRGGIPNNALIATPDDHGGTIVGYA